MIVYSKVTRETLHIVYDTSHITKLRQDLISVHEAIQVAAINITEPTTIAPHSHLPVRRNTDTTPEVWIVLQGSGTATLYDIDGSELDEVDLSPGGILITLRGGHSLKSSNMLMIEIKHGPYFPTKVPL